MAVHSMIHVIVKVNGFIEFYMHWYWSYSVKRATKIKLQDRRTLPASLVSHTGTVLSLLWPNKFTLISYHLRWERTMKKRFVGLCTFHVIVKVNGFIEFYVHWYWSYSVKIATKIKLQDRRTLPASPVSYTGTVLSLLWPSKFTLVSYHLRRERTMRKHFVGLYLESCKGHSHKKVARAKSL